MNKREIFTILSILVLSINIPFTLVDGIGNYEEDIESGWTILIYFAADNDLEDKIENLLLNLEEINNSEEKIKIVIMVDKLSSEGAWIYEIVNNERSLIASFEEKNTANPLCLEEFIQYGIENYPSEKIMLSIKNHGFGWRGICLDETNDNLIMNTDGFADSIKGNEIDLLLLDGESMASLEVAYELRNEVSYMVASESSIPSSGIPYDIIIGKLAQKPEMQPIEFAEEIVNIYYNEYILHDCFTISAINMSHINVVGDAFSKVTKILQEKMEKYRNIVAPARDHSLLGPDGVIASTNYLVDVYTLFDDLQFIPDPDLQNAIQKFEHIYNNSLIAEAHSRQFREIPHGLNLWFPPTLNKYQSDGATLNGQFIYHDCDLDIISKSDWVQCLMDYYGVLPESFELTSDADSPDDDGNFTLSWTDSVKSDMYSLYRYHSKITELNESLVLIESDLTSNSYKIENIQDGAYYYVIVAYNEYGYELSNYEYIIVEILPNKTNGILPNGFLLALIIIGILSIGVISVALYKKKR